MHFKNKVNTIIFAVMLCVAVPSACAAAALPEDTGAPANPKAGKGIASAVSQENRKAALAVEKAIKDMDDAKKTHPLPPQTDIEKAQTRSRGEVERTLEQATKAMGAARIDIPASPQVSGIDVERLVNDYYARNRKAFDPQALAEKRNAQQGILYFASLSMPPAALDRAIDQIAKVKGAIVLRGLAKPGDMKGTVERIGKLLGKRQVSFLIDPILYQRFDVRYVPSVVVLPGKQVPSCQDSNCSEPTPPYFSVSGDVSMDYALEAIARMVPGSEEAVRPYLNALRGKGRAVR